MKYRISITLDEEILLKMKEAIRLDPEIKSQSHYVETAIKNKIETKIDNRVGGERNGN